MLGPAGGQHEDAGRSGPLLGHLHLGLRRRLPSPQVQIVPPGPRPWAQAGGASCRPPNIHPIQTPRYMHLYRLPHLYTHPPIGPPMYMHLYTDPHTCICTDSPIYMHPYIDSPNTHPIQTLLYIHASIYWPLHTRIPIQTLPYIHASVYRHPPPIQRPPERAEGSRVCPSAALPGAETCSWKTLPRQSRERPPPSPRSARFCPSAGEECISH